MAASPPRDRGGAPGGKARAARSRGADRRDVALRVVAAVPLNYGCTTALTMLAARLLPGGPVQATVGATLLSFAIFAAIAMAAFAVRSTLRLYGVLIGAGVLAALLDWMLIAWGGRL